MGTMRHDAIVVSSWDEKRIKAAARKARRLGLVVSGPCKPQINGYQTFLVCPDGSKEGWGESSNGDDRREKFIDWMKALVEKDEGHYLEWVSVAYSNDYLMGWATDHAWKDVT